MTTLWCWRRFRGLVIHEVEVRETPKTYAFVGGGRIYKTSVNKWRYSHEIYCTSKKKCVEMVTERLQQEIAAQISSRERAFKRERDLRLELQAHADDYGVDVPEKFTVENQEPPGLLMIRQFASGRVS